MYVLRVCSEQTILEFISLDNNRVIYFLNLINVQKVFFRVSVFVSVCVFVLILHSSSYAVDN